MSTRKDLQIQSIQTNHMFIKPTDLTDWVMIKSGSFGVLHRADYLGTDVAVKSFLDITNQDSSFDLQKYVEREVDMLKDARHPNVVQFMGCSILNDEILLITEFVPGGNVKEWIQDESRPISDRMRISIAMDVAKAMAYLHSRGIIHRDLKTENLLVTDYKRIKVCDFGFSRPTPTNAQETRRLSFCGTDSYMAPEIILCIPFDHRIDVFSYGVILCELAMMKIAEGSVLSRQVPGFGISQDEVVGGVKERLGLDEQDEQDENELTPSTQTSDIGSVMRGFLEVAFGCADDDYALRMEWKTVMKKLKALEGEINRIEKEQGLSNEDTLIPSMSMPSIFSLTASHSYSAGLNKSANSSRIGGDRPLAATVLDAIAEVDDDKAESEPPCNRASTYNRILQDLGPQSKSEGDLVPRTSTDEISILPNNKSRGSGLQHSIPHKPVPVTGMHIFKLILKGSKCEVCDSNFLKVGDVGKPIKCHECGGLFHVGCEDSIPPSCGLPKELRTSLFPANPSLASSGSTIFNMSKSVLSLSNRLSMTRTSKKSVPTVFHAYDGDHFATQEFANAVNPDIHPPTPPLAKKKLRPLNLGFGTKTSPVNKSAPTLNQVDTTESKTYNYLFHDLNPQPNGHTSRILGSTRASVGEHLDFASEKQNIGKGGLDFDSRATLRAGASLDVVSTS
ncbi:hypothetical protein HDU79_006858 [Rhizoclosmatium sp. JEL0117]|nr:hypothetical protein HDU79_006858 [Rhizoclosmatium sp. JEL0117]